MTDDRGDVFAGVDTHRDTHHVAVVDSLGRHLDDAQFATTPAGYAAALVFAAGFGPLAAAGVEGTGCYGAAFAAYLSGQGVAVVEVNRPDRATRRRSGKSDPLDAYAAAWAAASGRASAIPKAHTGIVEAIRVLHLTRRSAVKARTQTINQLKNLLVTAPAQLREQLRGLSTTALVDRCAGLRPSTDLTDPHTATKLALRRLARRHQQLSVEITDADTDLDTLTTTVTPRLRAQTGIGAEGAAKLLIAAGDNPDRMHSEAAYAHLCAAAPIPASSGRTDRHRLNRGGNRHANSALHTAALTRLQHCPRTRAYAARRTEQGLSPRDILRCLKRYIARELFPLLKADLAALNHPRLTT
ncbi:MAG: IS110 family transposase [Jiangellaceae bacterium]